MLLNHVSCAWLMESLSHPLKLQNSLVFSLVTLVVGFSWGSLHFFFAMKCCISHLIYFKLRLQQPKSHTRPSVQNKISTPFLNITSVLQLWTIYQDSHLCCLKHTNKWVSWNHLILCRFNTMWIMCQCASCLTLWQSKGHREKDWILHARWRWQYYPSVGWWESGAHSLLPSLLVLWNWCGVVSLWHTEVSHHCQHMELYICYGWYTLTAIHPHNI